MKGGTVAKSQVRVQETDGAYVNKKKLMGATLQRETLISKPWTCLEPGRTRDETRAKGSAVAATVLMPFHHKIKTAAAPPSVLPGRLFSRGGGGKVTIKAANSREEASVTLSAAQ